MTKRMPFVLNCRGRAQVINPFKATVNIGIGLENGAQLTDRPIRGPKRTRV